MSDAAHTVGATSKSDLETDPRPTIALPRAGLPGGVIAAVAIVLAIVLFVALDARRRAGQAGFVAVPGANGAFAPPPALVVPPEPVMRAPVAALPPVRDRFIPTPLPARSFVPPMVESTAPVSPPPIIQLPPPPAPVAAPIGAGAQALVFDRAGRSPVTASGPVAATNAGSTPGATGASGTAGAAGTDRGIRAMPPGDLSMTVPTGMLIPAVLETPIDTARPGFVRAVVSKDVRGFDGTRVLIPRGSRLIGDYQADVRSGQNRVMMTWSRMIRPDGVSIALDSPAADTLGGAGVVGKVNSFFLQRFGAALLQSALTVGVNLASRPAQGSVIIGIPTGTAGAIGQTLVPADRYQPKIVVKSGTPINVFVAHDLDFAGAPASR